MTSHIIQYKGYNIYYYEPLYKVENSWFKSFPQAQKYVDKLTEYDPNNYQILTTPKNKNK